MKNMASIGFSKYSITEEGRIYSHKSNRFLNPYKSIDKAGGYFVISKGGVASFCSNVDDFKRLIGQL